MALEYEYTKLVYMSPEQFFVCVHMFFSIRLLGHSWLPLVGIISLRKTHEHLCEIENVTQASVDIGVSSKLMKIKFCTNSPS